MRSPGSFQRQQIARVINGLTELSEQNDQSREQICQNQLDDTDPLFDAHCRNISRLSAISTKSIIPRTDSYEGGAASVSQLTGINQKLVEDNRTLLMECVRLRKIVKAACSFDFPNLVNKKIQNAALANELNRLKIHNLKLCQQIFPAEKWCEFQQMLDELSQDIQTIHKSITRIDQLFNKSDNQFLKSSNAMNLSTQLSRNSQNELQLKSKTSLADRASRLTAKAQEINDQLKSHRFLKKSQQAPKIVKGFYTNLPYHKRNN